MASISNSDGSSESDSEHESEIQAGIHKSQVLKPKQLKKNDLAKTTKTQKSPQMTEEEKSLLLRLVGQDKYRKIVENKTTNHVWTSRKVRAWNDISKEFNSNLEVNKRDGDQLKKAWENLKSRAKKKVAADKKSRFKTGGGEKQRDVSPLTTRIISIVPAQMESLSNQYDDDFIPTDDATSNDGFIPDDFYRPVTESVAPKVISVDGSKKKSHIPEIPNTSSTTDAEGSKSTTKILTDKSVKKRKLLAGQELIVLMEEELQVKKLKLLDTQIKYEERKFEILEEEHRLKMKILNGQLNQLGVPVFDSDEVSKLIK